MKNTASIFTLLTGFVLFINSCACTEEACGNDISPNISVSYEDDEEQNVQFRTIYVVDTDHFDLIDSIELDIFSQNSFTINKSLMDVVFGDYREFKVYNYILKSNIRQDTLHAIDYKRTTEKIDCNDCGIFGGDGSETITSFKDLEFKINNQLFSAVESVKI
jgi:hypothetical protein